MKNIDVALPAYNEAESLPNLLDRFSGLPEEQKSRIRIFIVNDGSTDGTGDIARNHKTDLQVKVIDHPRNLGLGQAVQTAIRAVTSETSPSDVMLLMDADDTHDPELVCPMADQIEAGADIAIASRFVAGGDDSTAPFFRRLLSRGAAVCFKTALPIDSSVNDFTSGFRAYRVSMLDRAVDHWGERLIEENGFACMVELLLKLRYFEPTIAEVPMYLEYDRKLSASKIRIFRTIMQYLRLAIRDKLSPAPVDRLRLS